MNPFQRLFNRRRERDIESALRRERPKAPATLVKAIANRINPVQGSPVQRRARIAGFAAVTATMAVILGATGGLSSAANGIASVGTSVAHVTGLSTTHNNAPPRSAGGTYDSAPMIFGFSPGSGKVGATVTVSGANFTGDNAITDVTLDGSEVNFFVTSTSSLTFKVPTGATSGPISVTNAQGTDTSTSDFIVDAAKGAPTISKFSPTAAPADGTTSISISGTNLTGATAVDFNGTAATSFTVGTDGKSISAVMPDSLSGVTSGPIEVETPNGLATSKTSFTILNTGASVSSFSPGFGPVGTVVTITGSGFLGSTEADLNGLAMGSFKVKNDTTITAKVPTGATSGTIEVLNPNGNSTSTDSFTVNAKTGAPTISGFTPKSGGVPGSSFSIAGKNLANATEVDLNGLTASGCVFGSATAITDSAPIVIESTGSGWTRWRAGSRESSIGGVRTMPSVLCVPPASATRISGAARRIGTRCPALRGCAGAAPVPARSCGGGCARGRR